MRKFLMGTLVCSLSVLSVAHAGNSESYRKKNWSRGLTRDPKFFPLAVWCQSPSNAKRYKSLGVNMYVSLWGGPTQAKIDQLESAGMKAIVKFNAWGEKNLDNSTVVAWMHGDEPDMTRSFAKHWKNDRAAVEKAWPQLKGSTAIKWGVPIPPAELIADYRKIKQLDKTRPVWINFSCGLANAKWPGRGARSGRMEDYPEYFKAADEYSFDIYPATSTRPEVAGKLWRVPLGVQRMRKWSNGNSRIWTCLEISRINNTQVKPSYEQMRSEAWMSIVYGARGFVWFCHQFKPSFNEASPLSDKDLGETLRKVNAEVSSLAEVINSPDREGVLTISSAQTVSSKLIRDELTTSPIAASVKKHGDYVYVFATRVEGGNAQATFALKKVPKSGVVEVLNENRTIKMRDGMFKDSFEGYGVHLYRIKRK